LEPSKRLGILALATVIVLASPVGPASAQEPTPFANCRLGVGGAFAPYVGDYDIAQLNMGLYLDWWNNSDPQSNLGLPADVEYIQTVRVHQNKVGGWDSDYVDPPSYRVSPSLTTIADLVASQPGSLWLIGNEIERRDWNGGGQDEITPELYAAAFHEVREVIRTADPTARIGIGSVIEATPLRFAYLDRVWDSYHTQYGYSMGDDIDVWNIHGFLLREVRHSWGAEIPAGFDNSDSDPSNDYDPADGFLYGADIATVVAEHRNISRFQEFTVALREWMATHGEQNKPLINTEYGILYTSLGGYNITPQQVNDYLAASFDYMFTATDEEIGYPLDENRLVQGWVWYSLNDDDWNGYLFNPDTNALTQFGTAWRNYVSDPSNPLASQPQVNLLVANLRAHPNPVYVPPGGSATVTLRVDVANSGNTKTTTNDNIVVEFWDGIPNEPSSNLIARKTVDDIPGCGRFTTVEAEWPNRLAGEHIWFVQVVPITGEINMGDNIAGGAVSGIEVAATIYLPIVLK
jgi:hypothetical protein